MFSDIRRKAEREAKNRLLELFPSFEDHIRKLRIRYPFELGSLVEKDREMKLAVQRGIIAAGSPDIYDIIRSIEGYASFRGTQGKYEFGKTIFTRYIRPHDRKPRFHSGYVHEFIHYLTEVLARDAFGRAIHVKGHERYIPLDVWEGIAIAFQDHYLEQVEGIRFDPEEHKLVIADLAEKYSRDYKKAGEFDKERFARTYLLTREYLNRHGMDGAARRIPQIISELLGITPRNRHSKSV